MYLCWLIFSLKSVFPNLQYHLISGTVEKPCIKEHVITAKQKHLVMKLNAIIVQESDIYMSATQSEC